LPAISGERRVAIHELAELFDRDHWNVSADVTLLERLGPARLLVRLKAGAGKSRTQTPSVLADEIHVTIDLRQSGKARAT
jgi:predicted transcriptional regulator